MMNNMIDHVPGRSGLLQEYMNIIEHKINRLSLQMLEHYIAGKPGRLLLIILIDWATMGTLKI